MTQIYVLTDDQLDQVSGGTFCDTWNCCPEGVKSKANDCSPTYGDLIQVILDTAEKGRQIQQQFGGGGRPR